MKYLYSFIALFTTLMLSAQTSPITFGEAWVVGTENWTIRADNGCEVSIDATDPDTSGSRTDMLKVQYLNSGQDWQNAQIKMTEGQNRVAVGAGKTITFDIYADHSGDANQGQYTGLFKLEQPSAGTTHAEVQYSFPVAGTGWETITIDTTTDRDGKAADGDYALIVLFTNYGTGLNKKEDLRYYDNITFTDGSLIGADPVPSSAAPTPTHDAADVLNVYSDHYSNSILWSDNELRAGWSNGGETAEYEFATGDKMVKQKSANYIGHLWAAGGPNPAGSLDWSGHTNLNIDIWVPELTADATIKIVPLPAAGSNSEVAKDYTISAGAEGWRTITLDLTQDYIDLDAVNGVKIEPNPHGSIPIFYWDNLFAWSAPSNNTVASFSVDANNAGAIFDATGGEVLAISYSTDGGTTYSISDPLSDGDNDGIWTGDVTVNKDGSTVQYKLVTTDVTSGYASANASSGDSLAADADFSFTANVNSVQQDLVVLDRDTGSSFASTKENAVVKVTIIIRGHHPDHTDGQYGVRSVGGGCYSLGDWKDNGGNPDGFDTTAGDGIFDDYMEVPFYSTTAYNIGYHSNSLGWCNDGAVTKDAGTNADFSVTVVEDDVTEDITALTSVDASGNYLQYTSTLSLNGVNVELTMYPNPADQFISVNSSEVLSGIRVIDMTGKEVIRKSIQSNNYSLDLGNLNTGIYFLEATSEGASKTMRFIKK